MIVMKFGGTSVQNSDCINQVLDLAVNELDKGVVLVSSAMGKTTNNLISMMDSCISGNKEKAEELFQDIRKLHIETIETFTSGNNYKNALETVTAELDQLHSFKTGLELLKEASPRSLDMIMSFGERLSTWVIYFRALEMGISCCRLDSRNLIITDDAFNKAVPLQPETDNSITEHIESKKNYLYIMQGFISSTVNNETTTLGRGGSDYTAALAGAALKAEEIQIWTDVDGIMTSDPRVIKGARSIPEIGYEEAAELAYFGAKVVHPATIQPAVKSSIPVMVKNTHNADHMGTCITDNPEGTGIRAISGKKDITLINISSSKMLNAYGFLSRLFLIFEKYQTPVDLIATSEVSVSVTIEDVSRVSEICHDLEELGNVTIENDCSIICLVGKKLWKDTEFVASVFNCMKGKELKMISLGSSDTNLSLVVKNEERNETIQVLHNYFFND